MAGGDLHAAVEVEMKKREIKYRRWTNPDVIHLKAGGEESGDHGFRVTVRCGAAVASDRNPGSPPRAHERAVHLSQQTGEIRVEVHFGQAADIIFTKDRRVHPASLKFCPHSFAAKRMAARMLELSAWFLPAISYAVPWSTEVRTNGSPSVRVTPPKKSSSFSGISP